MSDLPPDEVYRQAQAAEYNTYVAAKPIFIGTARAFNEGDPVPASHVERGVVSPEDVRPADAPAPEVKATTTEPKPKADAPPKEG